MLVPAERVSPFDVNMAADAGFEIIIPYTGVAVDQVGPLVQDAIFSRPPAQFQSTGIFIGGHDINLAAAMLDAAKKAQVPPFEVGLFADPNGAYTTSAALVALLQQQLEKQTGTGLQNRKVVIYGGGPVGLCTAVLVAQQGGKPLLARLTPSTPEKEQIVAQFAQRYSVELPNIAAQSDEQKAASLADADVVVASAKAGIQVLSEDLLKTAAKLLVAADVNAVPPSGIAGLGVQDKGNKLSTTPNAVGIGALAIGHIKYKVQHGLLKRMLQAETAQVLDFPDAYQLANERV
jgi:methylene-tetrahydromethanopterin dehydrogenase